MHDSDHRLWRRDPTGVNAGSSANRPPIKIPPICAQVSHCAFCDEKLDDADRCQCAQCGRPAHLFCLDFFGRCRDCPDGRVPPRCPCCTGPITTRFAAAQCQRCGRPAHTLCLDDDMRCDGCAPKPVPPISTGQGDYARAPAPDALFEGLLWAAAISAATAAVVWLFCR